MFLENELLNGTYQIVRPIGKGGLGTIYLAYHLRLQKYVAVKRIATGFAQNITGRREADILKNLHHPNLPQVYDIIQEHGEVYTVIDYVDGSDLSAYIDNGCVCTEQQLQKWLYQLSNVLQYLHEQRQPVLHCDIKPGNIIITPEDDAVLIDFNISLVSANEQLSGISMAYASPEQMEIARELSYGMTPKRRLDGRTDVYSLAATFYHLISGKMPSSLSQMSKLSEMNLPYSEALLQLIDKAMSREVDERYPTAGKLHTAVSQLRRRNRGYRALLACRCAIVLLSGILLASGIYCLIHGSRMKKTEAYTRAFSSLLNKAPGNVLDDTEQLCFDFLNDKDNQPYLSSRPQDKSRVYALLADAAYADGSYYEAAEYYAQAYTWDPSKTNYLRDEIVCYAESGELSKARAVLQNADALPSETQLFVSSVLASRANDAVECRETVQALLAQSGDQELCARAAIAAASVSESVDEQLQWLELAGSYSSSRTVLRGLAATYAELAMEKSGRDAQNAIERSLSVYETLVSDPFATKTDRLNYATALRIAGRGQQAADVLEKLLMDYPQDYRILMQLAFVCSSLGDSSKASDYCSRALTAWKSESPDVREPEASENIRYLLELAERYGITP